jgi:8-oxo-dGTP diphosphatase
LARKTIHAAGGIVVRNGARPLIAVVQRSKDDLWVLPRGKLKSTERPIDGARREVMEETGHRVRVREFLGAVTYRAQGRPKVVQFWRMQAMARPSHDLMKDIAAVEWLSLPAAVRRLSYPLEKLFLHNVGRLAIPRHKHAARRKASAKRKARTKAKQRRRTSRKKSAGTKSGAKKSAGKKRRPRAHKAAPVPMSAPSNAAVRAMPPAVVMTPPAPLTAAQTAHRSMLQRVLESLGR